MNLLAVNTAHVILILVFLGIALLEIISGGLLIKGQPVARYIIIAFSILFLFSFPLGTVLGLYSLWVLIIRDNAGDYFMNRQ